MTNCRACGEKLSEIAPTDLCGYNLCKQKHPEFYEKKTITLEQAGGILQVTDAIIKNVYAAENVKIQQDKEYQKMMFKREKKLAGLRMRR